jgi:HlyD family secretion protein
MKKFILILLVLLGVGASAGFYYMRGKKVEPQVSTLQVTRGDISEFVSATGTLEAVTTVEVGTQVSGIVQELYADFNDIVRKGQIIAKLDPSIIQTQIEQNKANVIRAQADLERLQVGLADAKQKLERAHAMMEKQLIPRTELETAELAVKNAESQIKSSDAALTQARANLNTQEVNLQHTIIESPIDGIIISRNVDPGQTVAASMSAPTLYVIAADLSKMQVVANIDEADVGRMRPNQHVRFRVEAYPTEQFTGIVQQVRLQPTVVQNVVVYSTVIAVPNPQFKLKPGMTATAEIEIARRDDVLRVPSAALRFRPTDEMFAVLNQPIPPELQRGRGATGGRGGDRATRGQGSGSQPGGETGQGPTAAAKPTNGQPAGGQSKPSPTAGGTGEKPTAPAAQAPGRGSQPGNAEARGGGDRAESGGRGSGGGRFDPNMTPEQRKQRMEERLKNMTPEERERFEARMREGGGRGSGGDRTRDSQAGGGTRETQSGGTRRDPSRGMVGSVSGGQALAGGATTVDALFAPLPPTESSGRVWVFTEKQLHSVGLRLGISDSTWTELIRGDLKEGQEVVVNMVTGLESTVRPGQQGQGQNPLMPQPGRGGRGGGPGGGGGGNQGRGR